MSQIRNVRRAEVELKHPRFAFFDSSIDPDPLPVRKLKTEIADLERQMAEIDKQIKRQQDSLPLIEAETDKLNLSEEQLEDKQKKVDALGLRAASVQRQINSFSDRKYYFSQDLAAKRRELNELQPNGKPSKLAPLIEQAVNWGW
jgi:chromosome segregation ATPase